MRATPNPASRVDNYQAAGNMLDGRFRPSSFSQSNAENYIPVSAVSSNDIGGYVFQAYNTFINGVTALDAAVSIAESGETPQLFKMWQRRKGVAENITSGFLGYSFGWKPLLSDLKAISRELRSFPSTVRKRLRGLGNGDVVRHYRFQCDATVNDVYVSRGGTGLETPAFSAYKRDHKSVNKSRVICVTIRAKVKPKLSGEGQDLLNKLGAMGLIPSLATVWSITRLSFVVDWFYNIGGAIENLQGCLTHDITDVRICVSDARTRVIETRTEVLYSPNGHVAARESQRYYNRYETTVPLLPPLRVPRRPMQYVLLGLLGLSNTKAGRLVLSKIDNTPVSKAISQKITGALDKLSPRKRKELIDAYTNVIPRSQVMQSAKLGGDKIPYPSWWPKG